MRFGPRYGRCRPRIASAVLVAAALIGSVTADTASADHARGWSGTVDVTITESRQYPPDGCPSPDINCYHVSQNDQVTFTANGDAPTTVDAHFNSSYVDNFDCKSTRTGTKSGATPGPVLVSFQADGQYQIDLPRFTYVETKVDISGSQKCTAFPSSTSSQLLTFVTFSPTGTTTSPSASSIQGTLVVRDNPNAGTYTIKIVWKLARIPGLLT